MLGVPDAHDLDRLSRGVTVEGQRMTATSVRLLPSRNDRHATLQITIHEGRNRQVRNMLEAIGHPVDQLRRIAIGPIRDAKLKLGRWRDLTDAEVKLLKKLSVGAGSQTQLHHGGHREHGESSTHRARKKERLSTRASETSLPISTSHGLFRMFVDSGTLQIWRLFRRRQRAASRFGVWSIGPEAASAMKRCVRRF